MGAVPFSWQEIHAYQQVTGIEIDYRDASTLKDLSLLYVSELQHCSAVHIPPPFSPQDEAPINELQAFFKEFGRVE